jgi:hypothetical protein
MTEWGWYTDSHTFHLFLHFLLKSNFKPTYFKGFLIERGSLVCGLKALNKETGISIRSLRTSIEHLKSTNEVTSRSTNKFTIITICNYEDYQSEKNITDIQTDTQNDKQPTNNRQTTDKQPTTSKEVKKLRKKRIKEIRTKNFSSKDEIQKKQKNKKPVLSLSERLSAKELELFMKDVHSKIGYKNADTEKSTRISQQEPEEVTVHKRDHSSRRP